MPHLAESSDAAFLGTVRQFGQDSTHTFAELAVIKAWKGASDTLVGIRINPRSKTTVSETMTTTVTTTTSCDLDMHVGEDWLAFATRDSVGALTTSKCADWRREQSAYVFAALDSQAPRIPIRQLAPPDARTQEPLKSVQALVAFRDGRMLINDVRAKRLLFFDATLANYTVAADTMRMGAPQYPLGFAFSYLYKYLGDSAALTDPATNAFIIVGPDGTLGRTMAHVRPMDMRYLGTGQQAAFDKQRRFVYAVGGNLTRDDARHRTLDTVVVVRADFDLRTIDTLATITKLALQRPDVFKDERGSAAAEEVINLVPPEPDQWAAISDGSIAIVRTHDYHIDWIYVDGTRIAAPRMPFDWRRLTDSEKLAKIDSAKRIVDSLNASGNPFHPIRIECTPGPRGEPAEIRVPRCIAERAAGKSRSQWLTPTIVFSPPTEMLDYVPPIGPLGITADLDNHLWILPSTTLSAAGGGLLYDVVNRQGEVFERVQLPARRTIAGFGANGVVYLQTGDRTTGFTIERSHIIR